MIKNPNETILIPSPKKGMQAIVLDIKQIHDLETRIGEVAIVTPQKAPELLSAFNRAYLDVHEYLTKLEAVLLMAKEEQNKVKARVLLDKVPEILEKRRLPSSKDVRDAILALDEDYQVATDNMHQVSCVVELLKGKLKAFEMAYTSVKSIQHNGNYNMLNRPNNNLGADTGNGAVGSEPPQVYSGFGKSRY